MTALKPGMYMTALLGRQRDHDLINSLFLEVMDLRKENKKLRDKIKALNRGKK